ncbi:PAQR family membrane homeostasis protein TrhA [Chitinophaga nivalis]|uniref:Hemolysin III family protein n=1 Tax=Chitinophaga nivalis TaxID=2991709 RepID=A0ABT3IJD9_9BACT|nr:hemolysin III family protein [Chitinophaga nivalis]MCW3466214.1 hemolysin III family protein [Chitinophaga nivalis]MCW3484095.1 hemolysin III family protein [Chitinophaga nivalis]
MKIQTGYSRKQEIVNGLIHAAGIVLGISALPILTGIAATHGNTAGIIGAGIYSFCFLILFTSSTVYHLSQEPAVKKIFLIFDHISIYFLIAGTYTPFLLVYMNNAFGITLLSVLWGLTVVGIFFKVWFTGKYDIISTIIYLLMGWILVAGGRRFFDDLPLPVLVLISVGGGLYTMGVIFYIWDKYTYTHAIWHAFVLAAALCHYAAVLLAM